MVDELDEDETLAEELGDGLLSDYLSKWERGFIESLNEQIRAGRTLTERQREKLHQINDQVGRQ